MKALPKSKAKTAYGLLSEIRKLILAEPLRYNQGDSLNIRGAKGSLYLYEKYPACGTVGCVAGWTTALSSDRPGRIMDVMDYAGNVLGLSEEQADELFAGDAAGPAHRTAQTREHAERGAAHIAGFQKQYAKQLKAKAV